MARNMPSMLSMRARFSTFFRSMWLTLSYRQLRTLTSISCNKEPTHIWWHIFQPPMGPQGLSLMSRTALTHTHNRFTALFLGPPRWAGARRELLDFMVQGEINRGRHTNHPAGRHSSRTNQCPPPSSPQLEDKKLGPWSWRGLALASKTTGLGLAHAVLKPILAFNMHIPSTINCTTVALKTSDSKCATLNSIEHKQ